MFTKQIALAVVVFCLTTWQAGFTTVHAAPVQATKVPVLQQVGYAGQVGQTVTGQYPVTFRLYDGSDALLHEETITTDIRQGRFQVFVGAQRDLSGLLKDARQMKVFFQGSLLDSLAVIHESEENVLANAKQFSNLHAVIITTKTTAPAVVPNALAGTCSLLQSGFFTVPFTNTTVGSSCGGCGSGVQVSCGYQFLTTPSQGVIPYSVFPQNLTIWQVNYQVASTPATYQVYGLCCQ
jgi:hypothetical protein